MELAATAFRVQPGAFDTGNEAQVDRHHFCLRRVAREAMMIDTVGLGLDLPCTENPELFFAESPQNVEQAKAMCRDCRARLACLVGALERREPWGVWGGELLMGGSIVPRKRPRGRPRKDVIAIGASA